MDVVGGLGRIIVGAWDKYIQTPCYATKRKSNTKKHEVSLSGKRVIVQLDTYLVSSMYRMMA